MNQQRDTFVISRTDDGFRVYAVSDPSTSYTVGGGPERPTCTCAEFQYHEGDPNWRCGHIRAVLDQTGAEDHGDDTYEAEERAAIRNEGSANSAPIPGPANRVAEMSLKRSISPDGRIDSLSIEFSCPVSGAVSEEIKERAFRTLRLQDEIAQSFLHVNGKANGHPSAQPRQGNGALPATMLSIGAINTKWGRRLYIAFQANGQALKYFGSRKKIADALVEAGYSQAAERINEGQELNLPCRVVTQPSEDGKYINVERVMPANGQPKRSTW